MLFDFTDDQVSFARSIEALLAQAASSQHLRAAWANQAGDRALWRQLTDVGLVGLLAEQSAGGLGASMADAALPLERVGYHAAAVPVLDNAVVLPMLLAGSSHASAADWLARVATGDATVSRVLGPATE